ncbi:MAG TPA: family 20 glycosylhydrolase [Steroidobacteraceae bacterium]|nr:family 20 glycosylhydrolase [Steroidobacteraceae bacterium]
MTPRSLILAISIAARLAAAAPSAPPTARPRPAIIPNPVSLVRRPGAFALSRRTRLLVPAHDAGAARAAATLRALLARSTAIRLAAPAVTAATDAPARAAASGAAIRFIRRAVPLAGPESYSLDVGATGVTIAAPRAAGLLYGAVSLWQLVPANHAARRAAVPGVAIEDAPRLRWRGLLLDSVRHYQSPATIRRFIDAMALVKLNVLHWHLSDDQGWRLAVPRYPRLTSIGAWRVPAGRAAARDLDPHTHRPRLYGGFYNEREVRALVAYAAARNVTVVPEIEMPGHSTAAMVAYPRLASIARGLRVVPSDWGIYPDTLNLEPHTFGFLEHVLTEVMRLFPGPFVHIGGDEVGTAQWRASPPVQARARSLGIADPAGVQAYFMQRIARFLLEHGRRPVGWDEMLQPGLSRRAVIMSWHGKAGALAATARGNDAVLAPWPMLYLDNRQSDSAREPPGRGRIVTLEELYRFDPLPGNLSPAERAHVLGVEGAVWTEYMRTTPQLFTMTWPRAAALAETGWSPPSRRHWRSFLRRLVHLEHHDRALGLAYSPATFRVRAAALYDFRAATARVTLATQARYGRIRYMLDGERPTAASPIYSAPLLLRLPVELRAANFAGTRRIGPVLDRRLALATAQRRSSQRLHLCSERLPLNIEDDAPLTGPRAKFLIDIENPCWVYRHADFDHARRLRVAVGQIPFNFQIGAGRGQIHLLAPHTPAGELVIRLDGCRGALLARLSLAPALASDAVTTLPAAPIPRSVHGIHDLCLRFAQHGLDPLWAIDWIELDATAPTAPAVPAVPAR